MAVDLRHSRAVTMRVRFDGAGRVTGIDSVMVGEGADASEWGVRLARQAAEIVRVAYEHLDRGPYDTLAGAVEALAVSVMGAAITCARAEAEAVARMAADGA